MKPYVLLNLNECTYSLPLIPSPPPPHGEGKFIKSVGEEYQVMKGGSEYHGCGEEYDVEKGGSNIIFPIILRLLGRILSGKEGKGKEIFEEKKIFF